MDTLNWTLSTIRAFALRVKSTNTIASHTIQHNDTHSISYGDDNATADLTNKIAVDRDPIAAGWFIDIYSGQYNGSKVFEVAFTLKSYIKYS